MTFEFKPEFCKRCGQQKSFYPDGRREMRRRCRCELDRVRKNNVWRVVDPEFFDAGKRLILMSAWDPPLFSKPGPFPELIRAQRVLLAGKLYEFAFRQTDDALPITRSVNGRLNLFLRGPQGAGRGLVAANLKAMAALADLSVTPRDERCAWSKFEIFKGYANKAIALGSAGDEASNCLYQYYEDVDLMVIEGVRAETRLDMRGDSVRQKSPGAQKVDYLMAQRANRRRGSMVITSHDFLGQIRGTLGDAFLDEMCSQRTSIALLFSPQEAELLYGHLSKSYHEYRMSISKLRNKEAAADRKRLVDRAAAQEDGALVREALLFGASLGEWSPPGPRLVDVARQLVEGGEMGKDATDEFRMFVEEEAAGGRIFDDDRRMALSRVVSSCSLLKDHLAPREVDEVVRMVRTALLPGRLAKAEELAAGQFKAMSEV